MIKKMKRNFILIIAGILFVLFLAISLSVYIISFQKEQNDVSSLLTEMTKNKGPIPGLPDNAVRQSRGIIVILNQQTNIATVFYDINYYTEEQVIEITGLVFSLNQESGQLGSISFLITKSDGFTTLALIDREAQISVINNSIILLIIIEAISFVILMIIVWVLASYAVKPLKVSLKKQSEFVSDASHEIKTPLAIISSSAEVLVNDFGNSKWTSNILDQVEHMNYLVTKLLDLSQIEEVKEGLNLVSIDLSVFLHNELLAFDAICYEKNKKMIIEIDDNITINTDIRLFRNLINIFMDNAIKYSDTKGKICISLKKGKKTILTFFNTGSDINTEDKSKIFDRFYRINKTRTQDNSFGLGLSIAKSICDRLKYDLTVDTKFNEYTAFTIKI